MSVHRNEARLMGWDAAQALNTVHSASVESLRRIRNDANTQYIDAIKRAIEDSKGVGPSWVLRKNRDRLPFTSLNRRLCIIPSVHGSNGPVDSVVVVRMELPHEGRMLTATEVVYLRTPLLAHPRAEHRKYIAQVVRHLKRKMRAEPWKYCSE